MTEPQNSASATDEANASGHDLPGRLRAAAEGAAPQPGPKPEPRPRPESGPAEPRRVSPAAAPEILPGRASRNPGPPRSAQSRTAGSPTVMDRAMHGLRAALPLVQKVLPLLEGQVLTTLSNLLLPPHPVAPPAPDLSPFEGTLADLKIRHMELFNQIAQQNTSLKRLADRLDQVQESSDRNANEQKKLRQNLQAVGRKANLVALAALCLLALSLAANVYLFVHFEHALR